MKSLITKSLKAKAIRYQVKRFGDYRPQRALTKAISKNLTIKRAGE